jgi:two-component system sensor histidine kinase AlgZ
MKDSQILSGFQDTLSSGRDTVAPEVPVPLFNACELGVVLRAIALVESVMALAVMFSASDLLTWVVQWGVATAAALPALMAWLLVACAGKRWMARATPQRQMVLGAGLGALAGLYGCSILRLTALLSAPPWLACACSGAALATALMADWLLRYRGRAPADTAARLRALQSRIRPHFLFNTLNSAIALVRAEPARAEALLEDLSDLFRHALMDQDAVVTLADEIALARRYLAIEQVRFGARLQVAWELDPAADSARLPPLILQPLVENAVRHGIEPSPAGGLVRISTERRGAMAVIRVSNPVPTGAGVRGTGLALQNVRERLALLHDVKGRFRCGEKNGMYRVSLEVPL